MRKLFTLLLSATLALPAMAQDDEDVTSYIVNAGFDEDLTWGSNGETKEIVDKSYSFSNRSQAWVAADSTVYAFGKGTRGDGYSPAWNGFFGQIKGWTMGDKAYTGKSYYPYGSDATEWVYFGSVPYDLGETAVPIADDGTTFLAVPQKPAIDDGEDNKGFVYLRAGWGGAATYKQVVNLPCAQYRLEYWAINTNPSATKGKNLSRVVCRKDVFKDETGFTDTEWTLHTIEFTPVSEFTIEFGFQSEGGSGGNPFLCIDAIKLYKIGEADPLEILSSDMLDLSAEIAEYADSAADAGLDGLAEEIGDYAMELDEAASGENAAEMEAAYKAAQAMLEKFKAAVAAKPAIDAAFNKLIKAIETTNYPGLEDLKAQMEALQDKETNGKADDLLGLEAEILAALKTYYLTQPASEEQPANFTFLVKNPWFIKEDLEPSWDADMAMWIFPNVDNYAAGSSNDDFTSDGWYIAGISGGDQRLNWNQGRSCWNAWSSGFTGVIAVAQDLTDIPNGYYTVSADMITQSGYITDQHVFASSTAQKTLSPVLTSDQYVDGDAGQWDNGMTTEKVLVVDGKLTIGAEGTGSGEASAGWFLVTNFRLNYLGEASPEALMAVYNEQLAKANALAETMHFAADKKALQDSIAKYAQPAETEIVAAMAAMKAALTEAQASEAKYEEYMMEGKTLPTVAETLANENGYKAATEIVKFAYDYVQGWLKSDTATYTAIDATVDLLKNYLNTYAPVYNEADSVANISSEAGKALLQQKMEAQKAQLLSEMKAASVVNQFVDELKAALQLVDKQNTYDNADATDYTVFIKNPMLEAEDGWVFDKGNGNNNTGGGQWFDGNGSIRYIDSYRGDTVLIGYKAYQTIIDLPNGTYNVGAYTRTPAEGAYIFTAVSADTAYVEIPLDYYELYNETTGETEQAIASDTHGPIWEDASLKINGDYEKGIDPIALDDPLFTYYQNIYNANNSNGRGWKHQVIENVVVTNHTLTIGTLAGNIEAHKTEKDFGGNWYSVGGWTLTLVAKGDNSAWEGPIAAGIYDVKENTVRAEGIYTINGMRVKNLQRGLNIVVRNGKAQKIFVK